MIHQPSGGAQGQATDIKIHADHIVKTKQRLNQILAEKTGQPLEVMPEILSVITLCTQKLQWNTAWSTKLFLNNS